MTMVDERRVQAMPGHESTETGSDGLVIALGPKQLACVLAVLDRVDLARLLTATTLLSPGGSPGRRESAFSKPDA